MMRTFLSLLFSILASLSSIGQSGFVTAGGNEEGSSANISYSIGQVIDYNFVEAGSNNLSEGIQQIIQINSVNTAPLIRNNVYSISLYPNPTSSSVFMKGSLDLGFQIYVRDIHGKIILEYTRTENQLIIDLSPFSNGVYFIQFMTTDGYQETHKIIKK